MSTFFPKSGLTKNLAAAALLLAASVGTSHAQTVQFSARGANASTQAVFDYAQQVTLSGANQKYSISAMTFGINIADVNTGFDLILSFYTGANLSPTATNALANATNFSVQGFDLAAGSVAAAGSYNFTLTFATPITAPSNTFTIQAQLTTEDQTAYTTGAVANARFSLSDPTVGTSPGFVWADTNLDSVFSGAEQTKFGGTSANIRMDITATPIAAPEPGTNAALACGAVALLAGWQVRRRRSATA